jgi:phosphatidylglycerol:prolipoprotein diacylglycerol transferase
MLPYLPAPSLGPLTLLGVLVMLGAWLGTLAAVRHAERLALDPAKVRKLTTYCGVGTLIGAHLVDVLLYQSDWTIATLLNPFAGISSYGGLAGGTLGFFVYAHRHRVRRLRYADAMVIGVAVLMLFGRAGCATAHDHVGVATDFALAVDFPAGNPQGVGPHHDLGLLWAILLAGIAFAIRVPRRPGWLVGIVAIAYAVPRFALETLRRTVDNPRYAGLTPAQWGCLATVAAGVAVLAWIHVHRDPAPERHLAPTRWRSLLLRRRSA